MSVRLPSTSTSPAVNSGSFRPALPQPDPADLGQGDADQHASGDVDIRQLIGDEEQQDGQKVEQQFHAGSGVPWSVGNGGEGQKKETALPSPS